LAALVGGSAGADHARAAAAWFAAHDVRAPEMLARVYAPGW
jgi:hypothetical protein